MESTPRNWTGQLAAAVGIVMLCFVLATPRSGGPDEPSHMVTSAALVRGQFDGPASTTEPGNVLFDVPAMVGEPNPGCWALQPYIPAGCAIFEADRTDEVSAPTTSANYPPWALVLPGLASFVPTPDAYAYLARALMAIIPLALVVAALRRSRQIGVGSAAAVLLGLSPIAWFSMSIVNPSAVAIAGGLALWVALFTPRRTDILLVLAWAALLLPRRDGPLWATLVVAVACAISSIRPVELWQKYSPATRWALVALIPVPVLTALWNGQRDLNLVLALAPIALLALDGVMRVHSRLDRRRDRVALVTGCGAAAALAILVALRASPGGLDPEVLRLVVTNTGEHLRQLVGVLGWLDSPVPTFAVYLFWAAMGGLATLALLEQRRVAIVGLGVILTTVVVAWILELGQGSDYGRYWQGRYSLPFAVGLALVLSIRTSGDGGRSIRSSRQADALAPTLGAVVWVILNVGFAAAMQRWGVGLAGTWLPWRWGTYGAPIAPWLLLIVHALASAWLVVLVTRRDPDELPSGAGR